DHLLVDRAKERLSLQIPSFHADTVTESHKPSNWRTMLDNFDRATLGNAGRSNATIGIGHRARTDHSAGTQAPGESSVGDKLLEAEVHVAAIRVTKPVALPLNVQRQMHSASAPCITELIRGNRYRSKAGRGFGLKEPKACLQLSKG
ncbi:hypothetical protein V8Z76_10235, partial [Pediococcus acidilactici]